ncbi:TetR/AcrR family transcriptional regulator [Streptomyces sp. RS10V-4]|uniref:TetR/AcrR family transcriptional regulator n=1 Tax=Streptomyces rhizoryzae TaxID=2932493 RepID=UPI0020033CDD|nr:TetR/AcrR family transcriptional regulator [Streptomyces rhizoryzae]MCK7622325.1 TetR/AcrR family transcriptional regulator [Streptomyces rhizoryzae]
MTRPPQPRAAASRDRLLRAAAEELAGSATLEVAAVARRAGVSTGLPYRYFGSRSGLLIAVVEAFYQRLSEACARRDYAGATCAERERQRVRDWVDFLYAEPLAPMILGGLAGDGEVAAFHTRQLAALVESCARAVTRAQRAGELPADRDPELLAAATLGGITASVSAALTRTPRPPASDVTAQLWAFVSGAAGLPGATA